jgi:hypothetical protein
VFGLEPGGRTAEQRLSNRMHWIYGTALATLWPLATRALGIKEPKASLVFFALAWGGGMALLSGLKLAPPPTQWGRQSLAVDASHHLVYAAGVTLGYHALQRLARR